MSVSIRKALAVVATAAVAFTMAACSNSTNSGTSSSTDAPTGATITAPATVAADGVLSVGVDATYPPNESVAADGKTVEGMDIDLVTEVAKRMGLTVKWTKAGFDSIIPGIQSGKYEMGASSFTDNPEREKVVDFVTYYSAGTSWVAKTGATITPDTACGMTVAVQQGTVQVDDANARSKTCTTAGKSAITIKPFEAQTDATLAVSNGKADAFLADTPVAIDAATKSNGVLALVGSVYDTAPYGFALPKNVPGLATAVQSAVNAMMADGTYMTILKKWGAQAGAVTTSVINGAAAK
jgi:polar amino acid transport system substrate-binding protein